MKNFSFFVVLFFICSSLLNSQTIQWQQINGPHGGTAISFASNQSGDIFADHMLLKMLSIDLRMVDTPG